MDNDITVEDGSNTHGSVDATDGLLLIRPGISLSSRWMFNPMVNIGVGDSDLTYDAWPNFAYLFNKNVNARVGYRSLYYEVEDGSTGYDGSFDGLFVSVGYRF